MGTINTTTACGPDGQTIVTIDVSNGYTTVYIDGIEGHELVTGPGTHTVEWWGYPTSNGVQVPGPNVLWDTRTVTVEALTNCAATPTTTTPSPAPTAPPEVTESTTALAPPSTIPVRIDMDVSPCVTSTTGCTTVAVGVPPTLPATGDSYIPEITAGLFLAVGAALTLVARRRKPTAAQKRLAVARLNEVTS
jgi:LPXTG-motif cell wall-anchored protein